MPRDIYLGGTRTASDDEPLDSQKKIVQQLGGQPELWDDPQVTWQKLNAVLRGSVLADLVASGISGSTSLSISSAGTDYLNRLSGFLTVYELSLGAGSGPYARQLVLRSSGFSNGNLVAVLMDFPASTNPTINISDEQNGNQLIGSGQTGGGGVGSHAALFFFNGTNWKLLFWI